MKTKNPALAKGTTFGDYQQALLASSSDAEARKQEADQYAWDAYRRLFARNHQAMQRLRDEEAMAQMRGHS